MTAAWLLAGLVMASAPTASCSMVGPPFKFDQSSAEAGFRVRAGVARVRGTFGSWRGTLGFNAAGDTACLAVELDADSVTMGSASTTGFARGDGFFDARRHPSLSLRSTPFARALLRAGGTLDATLTLRGVARETPVVATAIACGKGSSTKCVLRLRAAIQRSDFGMRGMRGIVGDDIELELDIPGSAQELGVIPRAGR